MINYKETLYHIKKAFPSAKQVIVKILTRDDESISFWMDIDRFGEKDGAVVAQKDKYPFLSDEDIKSLTFDEAVEKYGHLLSGSEIIAIQSGI